VEVSSGELYGSGSGAGLDHVFYYPSKVFSAKCLGRFVISPFFRALYVICNATADIAMKLLVLRELSCSKKEFHEAKKNLDNILHVLS
jgi:hypothetical protein